MVLLFLFSIPAAAETPAASFHEGLGELAGKAVNAVIPSFRESGKEATKLLAIAILTGIAGSVSGKNGRAVSLAGVGGMLLTILRSADGFVSGTVALVDEVNVVIHATIPALTGAAALSGSAEAAVGAEAVYLMAADLSAMLLKDLLLPASGAYLALAAISAALENELLSGAAEALKNLITFFLRLILTVFIGYTAILKVFGTVSDSVAKRSLKLALNSSIPIIGGIASEAADSVFAVAAAAAGSVGVTGLLAILTAALYPVIGMCIRALSFRVFSFLILPSGDGAAASFVKSLADYYNTLLAIASAMVILALLAVLSGFVFIKI